ncbi:MAG: hypothetical protein ACRCTR_00170 [Actinomycetota bacterium]
MRLVQNRRRRRLIATVVVLSLMVAAYLVAVGWRAVLLIAEGSLVGWLLGVGVLLLPVVVGWGVWQELRFGWSAQQLADRLAAEGGLPVDDFPRRPSGRVLPEAAELAVADAVRQTERQPDDWRGWFRLALAYDLAGQRRQARAATRRAITTAQ